MTNTEIMRRNVRALSTAALLLATMFGAARAQVDKVPYVPTPNDVVERMLRIANVGAGDYVVDLGAGDGRILVTAAAKHGARGFGVDINPERIAESNANARKAGVIDRVAFRNADLFDTDISDATVLTMYLLPRVNLALRPKILADLKPGTRVVSHDFDMGEWEPDAQESMESPEKWGGRGGTSKIYLWIVPAQTSGKWTWRLQFGGASHNYELDVAQSFQKLTGSIRVDNRTARITDAKLRANQLSFTLVADFGGGPVRHEFSGRVNGDSIDGTALVNGTRTQAQLGWSALRRTSQGALPGRTLARPFNSHAPTSRTTKESNG